MKGEKQRLVVLSHSCVLQVNRAVYREIDGQHWDVQIITASHINRREGRQKAEKRRDDDPPIHLLGLTSNSPRTYTFAGLAGKLKELQPDAVVLEMDPVSRVTLDVIKWRNRFQRNALVTCISCENFGISILEMYRRLGVMSLPAALIKKWLCFRTRSGVDHVFTINDAGTVIFKQLGFKSISKIPLGFDTKFFYVNTNARVHIRREMGIENLAFAYFGRCIREKGVHLLLESLARIKDQSWHLMLDAFDASNEYSEQLKTLIDELGLVDRIKFVHSKHGVIGRYMNAADVVVVPSLSSPRFKEQYGRVIPEAMACGKLVIASDSGALPELIGEHGIIFTEGSLPELTEILLRVLKNPDILDLGRNAAKFAVANLSADSQADMMTEVLNRLFETTHKEAPLGRAEAEG